MNTPHAQAPNATPVASSVQYAENSIVSKQLINRIGGTITLFAFEAGQSLSEHTAPFDAFLEVVDGAAEVLIDGRPYSVKQGEFIILPANVPHAVNALERFKMVLVMVKN
jgi:quercetin dioxygenase-like cupin family protein